MECFSDGPRAPYRRQLSACIERWRGTQDRRALFAAACAIGVDSVVATCRRGRFNDSGWVLRLLDAWADHYFVTVEPADDDLTLVTPPAWGAAHHAAAASTTAPLDAVMLGVNAQVNNDLPQALAYLMAEDWPHVGARLQARRDDVARMLRAYAEAVDGVQCVLQRFDLQLVGPGPMLQVVRLAAVDTAVLVERWSGTVWTQAMSLVTAADGAWRDAIRDGIECAAARRAHLLMCRIPRREELLVMDPAALDRAFPHRHGAGACALGHSLPAWGTPVAASAFWV